MKPSAPRVYNEADELRKYIFGYCTHLFTPTERLGTKTIYAEAKAANASGVMAEMLRTRFGHREDQAVEAAISGGFEAFAQAVVARIQIEEADRLYINRCEKCDRIVATPRACVCAWCGHTWFERRDAQNALADASLNNC